MRSIRTLGISLLLAADLTVVGCSAGGGAAATSCTTDDQCGATGRCLARTCVANAPPVAAIALPGALSTFTLVTLDGSTSADPDPGDSIQSYEWTLAAVDAPCAAPVVASTGPTARLRFACPGRYTVSLVVKDEKGVASVPAVQTLDVAEQSGAAMLSAGPDLVLSHACADGRCVPSGEVALGAVASGTFVGAVTYHWTVEPPPDRALDASRRLSFLPSADVATPTVALETDDVAISGDWVFRVEARDDAGVVGTAITRVSITNRPPVITATAPDSVPHLFDAAASRFTASGTITSISVTDPDGDPIPSRAVSWVHANDGGGTFEGEDLGAEVTFRVGVAYGGPADGAFLIGGAGLERSVRLAATDVNGAETVTSLPIVIGNRPPALVEKVPFSTSVDHSYDVAQRQYRATATLSRWSDPDGDPLAQADATGDGDCGSLALLADGTAILLCSRAFDGVPAVALFATSHPVRESVRDPWTVATAAPETTVYISDRAPAAGNDTGTTSVSCTPDDIDLCCKEGTNGVCLVHSTATAAAAYTFAPLASDPDGDPVELRFPIGVSPASVVCVGGTCPAVTADLPPTNYCGATSTGVTVTYIATDGWGTANGSHTQVPRCTP